jgi:hypothetical protein
MDAVMTRVRSKHSRSRITHVSYDLRTTMCGKRCDGWIVEPQEGVTCARCHEATTTN